MILNTEFTNIIHLSTPVIRKVPKVLDLQHSQQKEKTITIYRTVFIIQCRKIWPPISAEENRETPKSD